jgi:hypothetical protein
VVSYSYICVFERFRDGSGFLACVSEHGPGSGCGFLLGEWRGWLCRPLGEEWEGIVVDGILFLLVFIRLQLVGVQAVV